MPASAAIIAMDAAGPSRWTIRSAASSSASRRAAGQQRDGRSRCAPLRSRDLVPEIARLMIRRWISLVPSKIV
jgi:hypothetical protein